MSRFTVSILERGGKLVQRGSFALQIGAYPETIKDTMGGRQGVPDLFLLPSQLFDLGAGVSAAELEFPLYYNYFIKRRKLRFLCRRPQLRPALRVLREALFGPDRLDHELEFIRGSLSPGYPDLAQEMAWFKRDQRLPRGRLCLSDCLRPMVFNGQGDAQVDGVTIQALARDCYRFSIDGDELEVVHQGFPVESADDVQVCPFAPPDFGVTIIGSGHGFDAASNTSGFIIWLHGKGILVDPPVNSTAWMRSNGINTRLIEDIILTHCHADHDSGTLQKVLQEGRVTLHTTDTVMRSFTRKYCALSGLTPAEFLDLFSFSPVQIDQIVTIGGAEFCFKYRLHPIPTLGFEVFFKGKSFVYSSDTLYDPDLILELHQEGILSRSRAEDLLDFPWHHSLVLHEAGIPPIHTPIECLARLPEEVKSRLHLVHISEESIPPGSGLKLASPGAAETLVLPVPPAESSSAHKALDLLAHVDLFRCLRVDKAAEFLRVVHEHRCQPGEMVIRKGDPGDRFYMVLSGQAEVRSDGQLLKVFGRYDYFGEIALISNQPRSADILARTELELLSMGRYDFLCFIRGTPLPALFRKVAQNRTQINLELLEGHHLLGLLSRYQLSQLMAILNTRLAAPGEVIFRAGEPVEAYYLVAEGALEVEQDGDRQRAERGALIGRLGRDFQLPAHDATARALTPATLYCLPGTDLQEFFRANPGFYMRVLRETGQLLGKVRVR